MSYCFVNLKKTNYKIDLNYEFLDNPDVDLEEGIQQDYFPDRK